MIIPLILAVVAVAGNNGGLAVVALILIVVVAIVIGIWGDCRCRMPYYWRGEGQRGRDGL